MKYFFFVKKKRKIIHDISLIKRAGVQKGPTHSEHESLFLHGSQITEATHVRAYHVYFGLFEEFNIPLKLVRRQRDERHIIHCCVKYIISTLNLIHVVVVHFCFCLFGFLTSSSTTRLYRGRAPRQERLTILRAATHETELGDHNFCLSRSHYTDTDPTCRERAATAGIEPGTSSPGVARSTAELPRPPVVLQEIWKSSSSSSLWVVRPVFRERLADTKLSHIASLLFEIIYNLNLSGNMIMSTPHLIF